MKKSFQYEVVQMSPELFAKAGHSGDTTLVKSSSHIQRSFSSGFSLCNPLFVLTVFLGLYFVWQDGRLYASIQSATIPDTASDKQVPSLKDVVKTSYKELFEDQSAVFILSPLCELSERWFHLLPHLYWLTPNMVSTCHLLVGLLSGWLVSCNRLCLRRIAAVLFVVRSFLDSYDGFLFRYQRDHSEGLKHDGDFFTFGYYYDGIADGLATIAFLTGLIFYFRKGTPTPELDYRVCASRKEVRFCWCTNKCSPTPNYLLVLNFGAISLATSVLWNTLLLRYTNASLGAPTLHELELELTAFQWSSTFLTAWCWKTFFFLTCGMFVVPYLTFFDCIWDYFLSIRLVGWIILPCLYLLAIFNLSCISSHIGRSV